MTQNGRTPGSVNEHGVEALVHSYAAATGTAQPGDENARSMLAEQLIFGEQTRHQSPVRRQVLAGCVAMAALAAVAALYWGPKDSKPPLLTYSLTGGAHVDDTFVASKGNATLAFTDGTIITLAQGTSGGLLQITSVGAHLQLHEGKLNARVRHTGTAAWAVSAGPFNVAVTGTTFDLDWSGSRRQLLLELTAGSVTVTGPLAHEGIRMVAGHRLTISLDDRRVELVSLPEPTQKAPAVATEAASTSPPVPRSTHKKRREVPMPAHDAAAPELDWTAAVSRGTYDEVVSAVERLGLGACYASCNRSSLLALGNAARFTRRWPVAQQAFAALRARFPLAAEARDATFLLGVISADTGTGENASSLFQEYLNASPHGPYAEQAMGRQLVLARKAQVPAANEAETARAYLRRYPSGMYAELAREILAGR